MAKISPEQSQFLKAQKISPASVFDASGLSQIERKRVMTALGVSFYYGGSPCAAGGHTLRTKAGHCIQCDTSKIAYQLRNSAQGHIYIAHSKSSGYIKVGYSKEHPQDRAAFLRNEKYGGIVDWDIRSIKFLEYDAGKKEFEIHAALEQFQKPVIYNKNGSLVECREIFQCDLNHALEAFKLATA